jgi:Na+-driven multidrug efflux pump
MLTMMLFGFMVGFTDVYVAGLISSEVQAAVGFITQIYFLAIIVANAISIGTLALISRAVGAKETERAVDAARQSLILGLIISAAFTILCIVFYRGIISTAGFPAEITVIAENFLTVFAFALGPNYLLIISNAIFRAGAEVKKPLVTMFIISMLNIALDFLLVFGIGPFPELGYVGIAYSTAISTLLGTLMNLGFLGLSPTWRAVYISMWLIRLPLAVFLALFAGLGATGVWTAMMISMAIQGIMMAWWFHQGRWKKLQLR